MHRRPLPNAFLAVLLSACGGSGNEGKDPTEGEAEGEEAEAEAEGEAEGESAVSYIRATLTWQGQSEELYFGNDPEHCPACEPCCEDGCDRGCTGCRIGERECVNCGTESGLGIAGAPGDHRLLCDEDFAGAAISSRDPYQGVNSYAVHHIYTCGAGENTHGPFEFGVSAMPELVEPQPNALTVVEEGNAPNRYFRFRFRAEGVCPQVDGLDEQGQELCNMGEPTATLEGEGVCVY